MPHQTAPVRRVTILSYGGNKYVTIRVNGTDVTTSIKFGYLYRNEARYDDPHCQRFPMPLLRQFFDPKDGVHVVQRRWVQCPTCTRPLKARSKRGVVPMHKTSDKDHICSGTGATVEPNALPPRLMEAANKGIPLKILWV